MNQIDVALGWNPRRLDTLRAHLRARGYDGCIVPRWDAYQSEYCQVRDERLAWISGFTGSWGLALVTLDAAVLFIDGRYLLQARQQVSAEHFIFRHLYEQPVQDWLFDHGANGQVYAYDPWILTPALFEALAEAAAHVGARLEAATVNPVDAVWTDRPPYVPTPVQVYPLERSGESSQSKRSRLSERLKQERVRLLVETQPDNLAWLLNVRGSDAHYTPVPHAMAVIGDDGRLDLCIDERKLTDTRERYELDRVALHPPDALFDLLGRRVRRGDRVCIDPRFAPAGALAMTRAAGGVPILRPDPLTDLKSVKNEVELQGLRQASCRDSIAWIRFLAWLETSVCEREAAGNPVTELEAEERILALRRELAHFVCPSFRTISAAGASAALCHYAAPSDGGRPLRSESIYLIDSGGQYLDGTTDTTRTLFFGTPSTELRHLYTLVLMGHARLATAHFPHRTQGHQIDAFAREPLWRCGLDYDHGTGHGVGHFLSVHEHPQRLMKDASPAGLRAGMTLTNEPGYYRAGKFGIRIENLCEIVDGGDGFLRLAELTLVPIARNLIDRGLLEPREREWLDRYHRRVQHTMSPLLQNAAERAWLAAATAPL